MLRLSDHPEPAGEISWKSLIPFSIHWGVWCAAAVWVCWPSLLRMEAVWTSQPQYSHGYLVPIFALYLLWHHRHELLTAQPSPSLWGLPVIAAGIAFKWVGTAYFIDFADDMALLVLLLGGLVTAGGWHALKWGWQGIVFLAFMVPLPFFLETRLQQTLLEFATVASTYSLQTLGYAAFSEGNTIHLPASQLGVLDACSGLRMGIVCTAMAAMAAMVSTAPFPQRLLMFLSGIPLALFTNVLRISVMGMVSESLGQDKAEELFHDASGYVMMLLAVFLLMFEHRLLTWIYDIPDDDEHREPMFVQRAT